MKKIYLLSILLLLAGHGFTQNYEWAHFIGGSGAPTLETANDIALDENGNVYTVGRYSTIPGIPVDFNPGPGNAISSLPGSYISKLDEQGIMVWTRFLTDVIVQGNSIHASRIESIAIDPEGNIIISGNCTSGADLNAGPGVFTLPELAPYVGGFIAKYSAAGIFLWAKALPITPLNYDPNFPASLEYQFSSKLATDNESNITMGITFKAQIDVDPGPDTLLFTTGQATNVLLLKLTSTGNLIWAKQIFGDIGLTELTTDVNDQIYLSGSYNIAFFDFQNPSPFPTVNLYDGYILKLTENGEFIWVKTMGGASFDGANSLNIDATGNVYCTGSFKESAWFKNTSDSLLLIASGAGQGFNSNNLDGFTAKLDSNGNWEWAKSFGDSLTTVIGRKIEVDSLGNTYTLAEVSGQITFNRGYENVVENFIGTPALAIIKHDANGNLIRVSKADGNVYIRGSGLELDGNGNLFFNGIFNVINNSNGVIGTGAIDMDPSSDTAALVGLGSGQDCIFVAKWSQCSAGSDTLNETACNSFTWQGENLTESGTYRKSLTTNERCDSIAVLNLNINTSSEAEQNIRICAGESITVGNQTYTSSGTFIQTLINQAGCDSVLTTHMEVDSLNAEISISENVFTAINPPINASFQWLNCEGNYAPIDGATNSEFVASVDGNYALETSAEGCRDTSDCLFYSSLSLNSNNASILKIYPVPANETLVIEDDVAKETFQIYDAQGRLILTATKNDKIMFLATHNWKDGLYFIRIGNATRSFAVIN